MRTFWLIVAVGCALVAAFFAYQTDYEKAFVAAALGAVAWILSYRVRLRDGMKDDEEES